MVKHVTIKFFLRTDQVLDSKQIPIYVRVILDREKFEFSSKQFVSKLSDWDTLTQRVKSNKSPINRELSEIEHRITEEFNFLKYHNKLLTAFSLRKQLKGEKMARLRIGDFADEYYETHVKNNSDYATTTKQTYASTIGHLKKFLEYTDKKRMFISEIDISFIKEFDDYLINRSIKEKKGLRKNSANKYHINMKAILFKAVDKKLLEKNPYQEFKFKSEPGRLTYLTSNELQKLEEHELAGNQSLQRVRDIFLFSVYTGLRHSDATSLTSNDIEKSGKDFWIVYIQKKTGEPNRIPMLRKSVEIYNKYSAEREITNYILPRLSHQKLNAYLKDIANLVGIRKPLSHHVARHTAATTIFLQNGISLETTGKLLGHSSIKSTQIYAKVTNVMLRKAAKELDKILR